MDDQPPLTDYASPEVESPRSVAEQPPTNDNRSPASPWKQVGIPILLIFLCMVGVPICIMQGLGSISFGDCSPEFEVFTFIDENADGIHQTGEPPLPGVVIRVGLANASTDSPGEKTNMSGEVSLRMGITGCNGEFPIRAEAPAGYRLTTPDTLIAKEKEKDKTLQFGFTYLSGNPTATPRSIAQCNILPEFAERSVRAITSDGSNLWIAASDVTRIDLSNNLHEKFSSGISYFDSADNIFVSPDGEIWLVAIRSSATSFLSSIYRLNGKKWEEFAPQELQGMEIQSIAWAPDSSLWFSTWGDGAFNWNPITDEWSIDLSIEFVHEILIASNGEYFPIEDIGGGAISPDGKVWGVTGTGADIAWDFLYYDPATGSIEKSAVTKLNWSDTICYSDMKFDSLGGMWLATCEDGLLYIPSPINGGKESWQTYKRDIGLPSNEILELYLQSDSILWIGTKKGLARCEIHTR